LSEEEFLMPFHFFRSADDNRPPLKIPALGLELTVRLPPETSDRALTILETVNAPGFGPPLHRHHETEIFRVLEGRYLFEVNGQRFEAGAGEVVSVPGGDAHGFVNISDKPSRQIVLMLPGMDAQKFFFDLNEVFTKGKRDMATLNAFGEPWGVEFLGPPIKP
jgi:quercetin dioxygenase-like cupin family protein